MPSKKPQKPRKSQIPESSKTPARLQRALSERIYLIKTLPPTATSISFLISGQSGKVYTTTVHISPSDDSPRCNCLDHIFRKSLCKHLYFLSARVLKLSGEALHNPALSAEQVAKLSATDDAALEIAGDAAAPRLLRDMFQEAAGDAVPTKQLNTVKIREAEEGEECPICYEELLKEAIAYCAFGCGRGVHADCFERYEQAIQEEAKCVLCRVVWRMKDGSASVGKRGVLVGRRLVDLGDMVPHMFVQGGPSRSQNIGEEADWEPQEEEEEEEEEDDEEDSWEPEERTVNTRAGRRSRRVGSSAGSSSASGKVVGGVRKTRASRTNGRQAAGNADGVVRRVRSARKGSGQGASMDQRGSSSGEKVAKPTRRMTRTAAKARGEVIPRSSGS